METIQFTREDINAMHENFREVKHSINNTLAVIMALSELAQRNPAYNDKLISTVLARCPDVVTQMQSFQKLLNEKLGLKESAGAA